MASLPARERAPTRTTHTVVVAAPPRTVYGLIADVAGWPHLFPQVAHVERMTAGATEERLRMWTFGNGAVRESTSRRTLDGSGLRIRFRQEKPAPPVASMAGAWIFVPLPGDGTSVTLLHEFRSVGDDPAAAALIEQAVDRTSTAELRTLRSTAELAERLPLLVHSFAESIVVDAEPSAVYEFLYRAQEWPRRLPHVSRLVLDEAVRNVQTIEMDTDVAGCTRTTRVVRLCFPSHAIVHKQTDPPELLQAHVGAWRLRRTAAGVRVAAHGTVLLRPEWAGDVLGRAGARERMRDLVERPWRRDSREVLRQAKRAAEGRRTLG